MLPTNNEIKTVRYLGDYLEIIEAGAFVEEILLFMELEKKLVNLF